MPRFTYSARSRTGEKVDGTVEANDRRLALIEIERLGHVPVSVTEAGSGNTAKPAKEKKRLKLEVRRHATPKMKRREMLVFTREVADLLASGMTLGNALNTLSRRKTRKGQDEIVEKLRDDIVQGTSLSDALGQFAGTFQPLYLSMVRAGEASGTLPEVLKRLVQHYERVLEAREKVLMALIYPCIVLSVGVVTMLFCMVYVVPRFSAIFEELNSTLPLSTQLLIGMSHVLLDYGLIILAVLVIAGVLFGRALRTENGLRWWHRVQLKVPVVQRIVTANAYAHFARTLGALLANGVPVLKALSIVEDTVGNVVIAKEVRDARDRVTDGATISKPLAEGKIFPPLLTDMLAIGEETGDMSGSLEHIANRYDDELDRNVKIFTTVLEPILILAMAVMVGFIAISMLMAVFDLTSGLNV